MKVTFKDGTQREVMIIREADLRNANLYGTDLRGANLYCADLYGADLRGADLRGANLRYACLYDANLYGTDLYGADLRAQEIIIIQTNRRQVIINGNEVFCGCFRGSISDFLMKNAQVHPTEYKYETMIMRDLLRERSKL